MDIQIPGIRVFMGTDGVSIEEADQIVIMDSDGIRTVERTNNSFTQTIANTFKSAWNRPVGLAAGFAGLTKNVALTIGGVSLACIAWDMSQSRWQDSICGRVVDLGVHLLKKEACSSDSCVTDFQDNGMKVCQNEVLALPMIVVATTVSYLICNSLEKGFNSLKMC